MPELRKNAASLYMDSTRNCLPSFNLRVGIQPRRSKPSPTGNRNRRCLRNDETTFGRTLTVIFDHQVAGNIAGLYRPRSCERRHHYAMLQSDWPNLYWRKQLSRSEGRSHDFLLCKVIAPKDETGRCCPE